MLNVITGIYFTFLTEYASYFIYNNVMKSMLEPAIATVVQMFHQEASVETIKLTVVQINWLCTNAFKITCNENSKKIFFVN